MRDAAPLRLRSAVPADIPALDAGLRALSADLGDPHRAGPESLRAACFGPHPACRAILAEDPGGALAGLALFSPAYSTMRGEAGLRVSDLWVAPGARGQGLGARLLAASATEAAGLWGAGFLMLSAYADNARALAFYARLGFAERGRERVLILGRDGDAALIDMTGDRP